MFFRFFRVKRHVVSVAEIVLSPSAQVSNCSPSSSFKLMPELSRARWRVESPERQNTKQLLSKEGRREKKRGAANC